MGKLYTESMRFKNVADKWYEFVGVSPPHKCSLILLFGASLDVQEMERTVHWTVTYIQRTGRSIAIQLTTRRIPPKTILSGCVIEGLVEGPED